MFSLISPAERTRRVFNLRISFILTEKYQGFDFTENQTNVFTTLNNLTEDKNQLETTTEVPAEVSSLNNTTEKSYNNIRELLQDDSMFHLDRDPNLSFESMNFGEDLNNNLGLEQIKEFESLYQDNYIFKSSSFEIYSDLPESLIEGEMTEKKENTPPSSPAPVLETIVVKKEEPEEKKQEFDLIKYIIFGDVSEINFDEFEKFSNSFSLKQNEECLTPTEEKAAPVFQIIKALPTSDFIKLEPSTSKSPSPVPEERSQRKRAPKRRYSSDSDFSIQTTASAFNTTSKRSKKRGRPAKELITDLPTIEDFNHLPADRASHLVLRIKNNEASRKSRMKSKSKQTDMEDECDRLEMRKQRLKVKRNQLEGQIETLRRWLLGIN